MGRFPSLYSLFETGECIEAHAMRPKRTRQRYISAWNFSAQLCAIDHSGVAPCFFPLDFSLAPGRRLPQNITTLFDGCPSLIFYEEYHKRTLINTPILDETQKLPLKESFDFPTAKEAAHAVGKDTRLPSAETAAPEPERVPKLPKDDLPQLKKVDAKSEEAANETPKHSIGGGEPTAEAFKPNGRISRRFHGGIWKEAAPASECGRTEGLGTAALKHTEDTTGFEISASTVKDTVYQGLGVIRRSLKRRCTGRHRQILIEASPWSRAKDPFISRLTREVQEIEDLILEFLETWPEA